MKFTNHLNLKKYSEIQTFHFFTRVLGISILIYVGLITSWISDDAQITFRQIVNFVNGDGITFNFGQRVQAFTHPIWFFLISGLFAIFRELFLVVSLVSIVLSISAVLIFIKLEFDLADGKATFLSPILFLFFSWAFCDYMTSGLENPLSFFLISILMFILFRKNHVTNQRIAIFIMTLLVLNRLDYLIIVFPLGLLFLINNKSISTIFKLFLPSLLLILLWLIFSTIYFGSPLPNTYFAKLNVDFPQSKLLESGLEYYRSLKSDPASIILIICGIFSVLFYRNKIFISLWIGLILYLLYIFYIGGDFMRGRFFSVPIFISIGLIIVATNKCRFKQNQKNLVLCSIFIVLVIIGIRFTFPPFFSTDHTYQRQNFWPNDQRLIYYNITGLMADKRIGWPKFEYFSENKPTTFRVLCGYIGRISLADVTKIHIDRCGLTDPFLSRLPSQRTNLWKIGHFYRKVPKDYGEYLVGNINLLPDISLNPLLHDIDLATKGKIFNVDRFSAIWRLNTGFYRNLDLSKYY